MQEGQLETSLTREGQTTFIIIVSFLYYVWKPRLQDTHRLKCAWKVWVGWPLPFSSPRGSDDPAYFYGGPTNPIALISLSFKAGTATASHQVVIGCLNRVEYFTDWKPMVKLYALFAPFAPLASFAP
jgi:hypothetical protein